MKTLLIAVAFTVVIAGPALACRGTAEFPQAFEQLEQSNVSPERKTELGDRGNRTTALRSVSRPSRQRDRMADMGRFRPLS